jgi:hypothetical protein
VYNHSGCIIAVNHPKNFCAGETMIYLLKETVAPAQIQEMLQEYETMIKIVVDIRKHFLSGGGEMHADCESVLLENGSERDDLWGVVIQDENLRTQVEAVTREILGGIK